MYIKNLIRFVGYVLMFRLFITPIFFVGSYGLKNKFLFLLIISFF